MRQKNIRRAAEALYESQADDKNKLLASFIDNKEVRKRVADQGRALLILERLCLPQGKFSFTLEEIHTALLRKLEKKGHRIQEDDAEDDEQYAKEKEQFTRERLAMVGDVLGKTFEDLTCGNLSPWNQYPCVLEKGHDSSTVQEEFIHRSENGVTWGYGGFAENQEKTPEPIVDCGTDLNDDPCHKDEFGNVVEPVVECGTDLGDWPSPEMDYYKDRPDLLAIDTEIDLPDVAWQLIGQAYIDGIRTGRDSK